MAFLPNDSQSLPSTKLPGAAARLRSSHEDHPCGTSPAPSISGSDDQLDVPPSLPPPPTMPIDDTNQTMPIDRRHCVKNTRFLSSDHRRTTLPLSKESERLKEQVTGIKSKYHDGGCSSWSLMKEPPDAIRPHDHFTFGFGLQHDKFQFQSAAGDIDNLKKKLEPMRSVDTSPPILYLSNLFSKLPDKYSSILSTPPKLRFHHRALEHSKMSDACSSWPRYMPSSNLKPGRASPQESLDMDVSPRTNSSRSTCDKILVHGLHEFYGAKEREIEESSSLQNLQSGNVCLAGRKRHAPWDEILHHRIESQPGLERRDEAKAQLSPHPRLPTISQGPPVLSLSQPSSYIPDKSVGPSNTITYNHHSPQRESHGGTSPLSIAQLYITLKTIGPSPQGSVLRWPAEHQLIGTTASPREVPKIQNDLRWQLKTANDIR
ncbi:unnamed protein product [Clonostachys rosea]|uniref:Uncharacterized protein n=1 Tax=Bionectria ochroleuca TaxID=29856 RepID=A0ABY6U6T2_BIOOC|nr:unnamed protein product [Clonostachys rosea]